MSAKSEYDAAYFTLLRAREEQTDLLRYREYLESERERLDAFVADTRDRADHLPRRMRRPVDQTTKGVMEAVGRRRAIVLNELKHIDERLSAAQAFVEECELEVAALRQ